MRLLLAVALLFALPRVAIANDAEEARIHYERGLSAYALEHFTEAAEEYEKAFTLKTDPALLYNAAQAHRLAGNNERALRLYRSFLRLFGDKASAKDKDIVARHIRELEAAVETQHKAQTSPPTEPAKPADATAKPSAPSVTAPPPAAATPAPTAPASTLTTPTTAETHGAPSNEALNLSARPPERQKPVYKKAWFWGAVVGGAALVAVGVGLGVGLSSGGTRNPTPSFGSTTVQ